MTKSAPTRITAPIRTDAAGAQALAMQMETAVRSGFYNITLDMSATVFLSSAGLRVLLMYHQKMKKLGGFLVVEAISQVVRETLQQCNLMELAEPDRTATAQPPVTGSNRLLKLTKDSAEISMERLDENPPGKCLFFGKPCLTSPGSLDSALLYECLLEPDLCGVGIGAFGAKSNQTTEQLGEWMCARGLAISAPPGSVVPDYMLATGALRPKAQLLYAACFKNDFTEAARFSAIRPNGDAILNDLLDAALEWSKTNFIGIMLIGITSGLVGASLIKLPAAQERGHDFFAHPGVRGRLAFTPEPEHAGNTAVVVGIASRGPQKTGGDFLKLLDSKRGIWAHLHAAAFSFRAMPAGYIAPPELLRELAETEKLLAVLHLLNDERPVVGTGESSFKSGALWTASLQPQESVNS